MYHNSRSHPGLSLPLLSCWGPARTLSSDKPGRDYLRVIPVGIQFQLRLVGQQVALADGAGNMLSASGQSIAFQAIEGVDQFYTFRVTGAKISGR